MAFAIVNWAVLRRTLIVTGGPAGAMNATGC
jgi:hypothetical protein